MQILGTTETSYNIERLIRNAEEILLIISPYLRITKRLKVELEDAFERCKENIIVYRENQLPTTEFKWLKTFPKLNLIPVENLHAKCYLNESEAIITSMNLYEYSQINNHELGVHITALEESENFLDVIEKIELILRTKSVKIDFSPLTNRYGKFSMGDLVVKLNSKFNFKVPRTGLDSNYRYLCQEAKAIMKFQSEELYQDGTSILRSTNLGKVRFDILYKDLSKLGIQK
ncbi:phospholipase D family protein [Maribellus sediminis]|uniref:phospholipase D family protein n=1 Tax=Maribellus sediminis TaxID=2696285 RepID=UPI0014322A32|nr:phospholipase D family protein [Maribellus sediminis]